MPWAVASIWMNSKTSKGTTLSDRKLPYNEKKFEETGQIFYIYKKIKQLTNDLISKAV